MSGNYRLRSPESSAGIVTEASGQRPQHSGATRIVVALWLWGSAIVLVGFMAGTSTDSRVVLSSTAATLVGVGSFLLVTRQLGGLNALGDGKLGPWATLTFAFLFGLSSITWVEPQVGLSGAIMPESVVRALMLLMVAQVVWTAAYLIGPGSGVVVWGRRRLIALLDSRSSGRVGPGAAWMLFVVAVLGQGLRVLTGSFGYVHNASVAVASGSDSAQLVALLASMGDFALVAAAFHYFRRDGHSSRTQVVVIAGFLAVVGLLAGTKEPVVLVAVDVVLAYAVARRRFPVRLVALSLALFMLVVLPFVTAYRSKVRGEGGLSVSAAIQAAPDVARTSTGTDQLAPGAQVLSIRLREIDSVAMIVQKSPEIIPYRPLSEFAFAVGAGVVPRAIWVDKPVFASGYEFAREYFGQGERTYSSSAISPQGDLLRHGGVAILLTGMLLVGMAMRTFDDVLQPELDYRALFFVIMLFPVAAKQEQDMVTFLLSLPGLIITPIFAIWLTGLIGERRASSRMRAALIR